MSKKQQLCCGRGIEVAEKKNKRVTTKKKIRKIRKLEGGERSGLLSGQKRMPPHGPESNRVNNRTEKSQRCRGGSGRERKNRGGLTQDHEKRGRPYASWKTRITGRERDREDRGGQKRREENQKGEDAPRFREMLGQAGVKKTIGSARQGGVAHGPTCLGDPFSSQ